MHSQPIDPYHENRLPTPEFEAIIEYNFKDASLLEEALTHPSICRRGKSLETGSRNYERLEFLGDGVLGLLSSELLMELYPDDNEGSLAIKHAAMVRGAFLMEVGKEIRIGHYLSMARGEARIGGRINANNLENAVEALLGALYADGGMNAARKFYRKYWTALAEEMEEAEKDPKTELQEWCQRFTGEIPQYLLVKAKGPDHSPTFTVRVSANGVGEAEGTAPSKKKAEKIAAKKLHALLLANEQDADAVNARLEEKAEAEERKEKEERLQSLERLRHQAEQSLSQPKETHPA